MGAWVFSFMSISITQQVNRQLAFARILLRSLKVNSASQSFSAEQSDLLMAASQQAIVVVLYKGLCLYLEELQVRLQEQGVSVSYPELTPWLQFSERLAFAVDHCSAPEFGELASLAENKTSWVFTVLQYYTDRGTLPDIKKPLQMSPAGVSGAITLVDLDGENSALVMTPDYIDSVISAFVELVQRHRESLQYY